MNLVCTNMIAMNYAYLMVSYLIDTLGKDNFVNLLRDKEQIEVVKDELLNKSINYYNEKYNEEKSIKK